MKLGRVKDFVTVGSANVTVSVVNGLFWLFLASILLKTEYGELAFVMSVANMGAGIAILGLRPTVTVYEAKDLNIFPASFFVILASSSITGLGAFVFTQNVFASILIVGMTIFEIMLGGINGKRLYGSFSKYKVIRAAANVAISLVLFQFLGINGVLLGFFIATLFILKELKVLFGSKHVDFGVLKQKVGFISSAYINRLSRTFFIWGDKVVIGIVFGLANVASYYFAMQYLLLLYTIPRSLAIYLVPLEARGQKNKKFKVLSVLFACGIAAASIIAIPFGVSTILPKYEDAITPMQVLSVALIPLTISRIQESEFMGKENARVVLIGSVIESSLYLALIFVLGNTNGIVGIAIGLLTASIARVGFNLGIKAIK